MSRPEPVYVHPVAAKVDIWTKTRVQEEAAKRKLTESEYVRWVLEAFHKVSTVHTSGNPVYDGIGTDQ